MRKLILRNFQCPGDILMLTAAVRDLHRAYPGEFITDVRTPCPDLWRNNPYLTPLDEEERGVETTDCQYPLIHESNQGPWHFLHGFIDFLNRKLTLAIRPTAFRGDIHLSEDEKSVSLLPPEVALGRKPFWIVVAGGKTDFTIKWWEQRRYQEVVDHFRGRLLFVQTGERGHVHPPLANVIDLRGRTSLRDLVRLVYHSSGVLTPVSLAMHLAAAVDYPKGEAGARPCVVVAGGREPPHWEAYPAHQFLHTVGMLSCCASGGCWKSRTRPLGDGQDHDAPDHLCVDPAGDLPRCMDMIQAGQVIERIQMYTRGGREVRSSRAPAVVAADVFLQELPQCPDTCTGRGIVICAGGLRYFPSAYVTIRRLRALGCRLPVELWYRGPGELDATMAESLGGLDVRCVDAFEVRRKHPMDRLNGWELKPYSMLHSSFRHVLLLDADNLCYRDPEFLFETEAYGLHGAIFWPDLSPIPPGDAAWDVFGVEYRDEPSFESGQIVLDKERCWSPLLLTVWYNGRSAYFYRFVHGDKDTFHMAFRRLGVKYAMPPQPCGKRDGVFTQFDFDGKPLFQHGIKWELRRDNRGYASFAFFPECQRYLEDLGERWNGYVAGARSRPILRPAWSFAEA